MNYGPLIFLGAFLSLALSWYGFVFTGLTQIGKQQPVMIEATGKLYPAARPGLAAQGAEVYRAQGCYYCHSQQVDMTHTEFAVVMMSPGTNDVAVTKILHQLDPSLTGETAKKFLATLPHSLDRGVTAEKSAGIAALFKDTGVDIKQVIVNRGLDVERGWGSRRTVAQDYLFDHPVMLGSQRIGPDLASIGTRSPGDNWQLVHLYNPRIVPGKDKSMMPSYQYLFVKRLKIGGRTSPDALVLPEGSVDAGYEVVPKHEATALVAYLQSLRIETPLPEAPLQPPAPPKAAATNAAPATATPVPAK